MQFVIDVTCREASGNRAGRTFSFLLISPTKKTGRKYHKRRLSLWQQHKVDRCRGVDTNVNDERIPSEFGNKT